MVETNAGRMVAEEFGAEYFECSAKTGLMVEEAFVATAIKVRRMSVIIALLPNTAGFFLLTGEEVVLSRIVE